MSCEKLYFSPFGAHWGFCTKQRLGAQRWSLSTPVLDGFKVCASWLVGPRRVGNPAAPGTHLAILAGRD